MSGELPLALEVNYRLFDNCYLGGAFQYGFAAVGDTLRRSVGASVSWSAHTLRVAMNVFYHLGAPQTFHGWVGGGLGYEQVTVDAGAAGRSISQGISGAELSLQGGLDYPLTGAAAVGPFASASLGQFTSADVGGRSGDISNTSSHGWLTLGLRLSVGI